MSTQKWGPVLDYLYQEIRVKQKILSSNVFKFSVLNLKPRTLFVILGFLFFGVSVYSQKSFSVVPDGFDVSYICRFGRDVRTLRVIPPGDDGRCQTVYTKEGVDQSVGKGQNPKSCLDIMEGIRGRIEAGGWKCREIKGAKVSALPEEAI